MTERSKLNQSLDSRNGEHRGGKEGGREERKKATLHLHTLRFRDRATMEKSKLKVEGVIFMVRVYVCLDLENTF